MDVTGSRWWPCPRCKSEDPDQVTWGLGTQRTTDDGRRQDVVPFECAACGQSGTEVVSTR